MSANVVTLAGAPLLDNTELLQTIDNLRAMAERGEIVAFAAVGIESSDATRYWTACSSGVTKLRLIGAAACLQAGIINDT